MQYLEHSLPTQGIAGVRFNAVLSFLEFLIPPGASIGRIAGRLCHVPVGLPLGLHHLAPVGWGRVAQLWPAESGESGQFEATFTVESADCATELAWLVQIGQLKGPWVVCRRPDVMGPAGQQLTRAGAAPAGAVAAASNEDPGWP